MMRSGSRLRKHIQSCQPNDKDTSEEMGRKPNNFSNEWRFQDCREIGNITNVTALSQSIGFICSPIHL
jgi:hypothetical protein